LSKWHTVARWAFVASLPGLIMTATVAAEFNSLRLYTDGFAKYHVSETTGLSPAELTKAARGIISYFNSGEEYLHVIVEKHGQPFTLFNEREVSHMKDVKALVQLDYKGLIGTAIYAGLYTLLPFFRRGRRKGDLARATVWGSAITLGILVALGIGTASDFDALFLRFHFLAFTNDLWLLDPTRDYLIMLFPEGFWFDAGMLLGVATTATAATLLGVSLGYLRKKRRAEVQLK
jgi:integral membrane protein (TIGR01906 family)